jgi:hypothetical protein
VRAHTDRQHAPWWSACVCVMCAVSQVKGRHRDAFALTASSLSEARYATRRFHIPLRCLVLRPSAGLRAVTAACRVRQTTLSRLRASSAAR